MGIGDNRELVKLLVGIAWPAAILWVVLAFRTELRALLGRIVSVEGPAGIKAQFRPPEKSGLSLDDAVPLGSPRLPSATREPSGLAPLPDPHLQALLEKAEEITKAQVNAGAGYLNVAPERLLLRLAADFGTALMLERASRVLFGSQIAALQALQQHGGAADRSVLRPLYDDAATQAPAFYRTYTFEQWLQFLVNWTFVTVENDKVTLTVEGAAVVPYLLQRQYLLRPPG